MKKFQRIDRRECLRIWFEDGQWQAILEEQGKMYRCSLSRMDEDGFRLLPSWEEFPDTVIWGQGNFRMELDALYALEYPNGAEAKFRQAYEEWLDDQNEDGGEEELEEWERIAATRNTFKKSSPKDLHRVYLMRLVDVCKEYKVEGLSLSLIKSLETLAEKLKGEGVTGKQFLLPSNPRLAAWATAMRRDFNKQLHSVVELKILAAKTAARISQDNAKAKGQLFPESVLAYLELCLFMPQPLREAWIYYIAA